MQDTGGVRKVRVGRGGRGKSGGGQVVYICYNAGYPIFLLAAFAKNEKSNLSKAECNGLSKIVKGAVQTRWRGCMSGKAFEKVMRGLGEAKTFLEGEREGYKVTVPPTVDVKSIRNGLKMTQAAFSDRFGFSLDAVKHWEGGRRTQEVPARAYLTVIQRNPSAVLEALRPASLCDERGREAI